MGGYRTWQDFDDAPSRPATADGTGAPNDGGRELRGTADELSALGGAPEVVELLRRKEQLEAQLHQLSGGAREPDDERRAKCFPVKVHTKETRIEERRLRLRDEQLALLNQRVVERAHLARARAETERQLRLRQLEAAWRARLDAEQRAQAQRHALEHATLARRRNADDEAAREFSRQEAERRLRADALAAERREWQAAENARRAEERETLVQRWEADRKIALARTRQEEEQERRGLEHAELLRREAAVRRVAGARAARVQEQRSFEERRDRRTTSVSMRG